MTVGKLVDLGITRVWWVTTMAIAGQPTVAEIGAGKDLSPSLLPDYVFNADASTTISERDITAVVDAETERSPCRHRLVAPRQTAGDSERGAIPASHRHRDILHLDHGGRSDSSCIFVHSVAAAPVFAGR